MVAPCLTTTFRRNPPYIWCSAFVVVPRNARRRITPLPRRTSISTRKSSWLCWSTTRYTIPLLFFLFCVNWLFYWYLGRWKRKDQPTSPGMPRREVRSRCFHGRSQGSSILREMRKDLRFQRTRVRWVSVNNMVVRRCGVENTLWLCKKDFVFIWVHNSQLMMCIHDFCRLALLLSVKNNTQVLQV